MDCGPPGFSVHGILQARTLEWVAVPSSWGNLPNPGIEPRSHIAGRFFTVWATMKPKNSEVDSPLLLQGIFLTPELNWGLLHFRQILYQLSYQGSLQRKLERKWKWKPLSRVPILCNPMDLNSPWNSPGQSTGVGSLSFLQKIFPTQGSNPDLLHCRQLLYQQSYQGSPELSERAKSSLFNI